MQKNRLAALGLVAGLLGGAAAGIALGAPSFAGAQADDTATTAYDPALGGHVGQNGVKEELLTGDTAEKVKAAALAAVPGGTIERVENDAEGSPYEAHMTKADGSHVTVKLDSSFAVTSVEDGHK